VFGNRLAATPFAAAKVARNNEGRIATNGTKVSSSFCQVALSSRFIMFFYGLYRAGKNSGPTDHRCRMLHSKHSSIRLSQGPKKTEMMCKTKMSFGKIGMIKLIIHPHKLISVSSDKVPI
jgi:hypothetical protein